MPFAHLHAGSPTVSKNRQVPPFMQKSPAIGQGCSCRGHAAVAVIRRDTLSLITCPQRMIYEFIWKGEKSRQVARLVSNVDCHTFACEYTCLCARKMQISDWLRVDKVKSTLKRSKDIREIFENRHLGRSMSSHAGQICSGCGDRDANSRRSFWRSLARHENRA
jgi:hypothetical protein